MSVRIPASSVRIVPIIQALSGMMFSRNPGVKGADGEDGWRGDEVGLAANDGLHSEHDLCAHDDGVDARRREGAVRLPAMNHYAELVGGSGHRAAAPAHGAERTGPHMQAKDRVDLGVLEDAGLDHRPCPADRRRFLGGLEDELHGAGETGLHPGEYFGRSHEDGDVVVVPAGVHDSRLLSVVDRADRALEREIDHFGDGERVHVGAQRDDGTGQGPAQDPDDAIAADTGLDFETERLEMIGDELGGARLLERQLGVLVNVLAPGDHLGGELGGATVDDLVHGLHVAALGGSRGQGRGEAAARRRSARGESFIGRSVGRGIGAARREERGALR